MKTLIISAILMFAASANADDVTFADVFDQVISQKCILCHSNPEKDPKDLTTYIEVMNFVVPGDPLNSKIFQMVSEAKMPPPKVLEIKPELTLTPEDLDLIETWIAQGALE